MERKNGENKARADSERWRKGFAFRTRTICPLLYNQRADERLIEEDRQKNRWNQYLKRTSSVVINCGVGGWASGGTQVAKWICLLLILNFFLQAFNGHGGGLNLLKRASHNKLNTHTRTKKETLHRSKSINVAPCVQWAWMSSSDRDERL